MAEAIYALALDIVGDEDALSAQDRIWLHRAIDAPVSEATEEALRVLTTELAVSLRSAPSAVRPSIRAVPVITRTDFE